MMNSSNARYIKYKISKSFVFSLKLLKERNSDTGLDRQSGSSCRMYIVHLLSCDSQQQTRIALDSWYDILSGFALSSLVDRFHSIRSFQPMLT